MTKSTDTPVVIPIVNHREETECIFLPLPISRESITLNFRWTLPLFLGSLPFQDFFNEELNKSINPYEAVAHGAAVQAAILHGDEVRSCAGFVAA